jgi:hypothetical protein
MKRALAILAISFLFALPAYASTKIGDLQLATNFDTLIAQAQQSHKTIVLKFYTDW